MRYVVLDAGDPGDETVAIGPWLTEKAAQRWARTHKKSHLYNEQQEAAGDVRGCSCGNADYGAPGHDGGPELDSDRTHPSLSVEQVAFRDSDIFDDGGYGS